MNNYDNVVLIARSPYLTSLRSNLIISTMAKPKMQITKVLGGGCPSKQH